MIMYKITLILASIGVFVYTTSYGVWEWNSNNKSGCVFALALAVCQLGISVYTAFVY